METKILILFQILIFIYFPGTTICQEIYQVRGEAQVRIEMNMTEEDARDQSRELAKINAIEKLFGTYVEQVTDIIIKDGRTQYDIIGTTKVKGEWIETIDEKITKQTEIYSSKNGKELVSFITCNISGKVREATQKANIQFQTLNCPDKLCRATDFYTGESLFLYFKSPVDGYLSVFLDDGDKVYRLFPYITMTGKEISTGLIKADTDYILFSKNVKNVNYPETPDECELFTLKQMEYNKVLIVFSEVPYFKPILNNEAKSNLYKEDYIIPKSLSIKEFEKWLADNRAKNPGFIDAQVRIKISSK
ncbi:MAG: hypothetical protein NTX61_01855 [Bacteroidetes bacterium]|nr:hypothetical protein [Bacteroidota bacterium]